MTDRRDAVASTDPAARSPALPVWFVRARRGDGWVAGVVEGPQSPPSTLYLVDLIRSVMGRDTVLDATYEADAHQVDEGRVQLPHRTVATIVETLRQVAGWLQPPDDEMLRETATTLEVWVSQIDTPGWADDLASLCCPMCQEVECDGGCPLEGVRAWAQARTGS